MKINSPTRWKRVASAGAGLVAAAVLGSVVRSSGSWWRVSWRSLAYQNSSRLGIRCGWPVSG
jgi:hypothetical protein